MTTNTRAGQVWQYNNEKLNNSQTWLLLERSDEEGYPLPVYGPGELWKIYHLEDSCIYFYCNLYPTSTTWRLLGDVK